MGQIPYILAFRFRVKNTETLLKVPLAVALHYLCFLSVTYGRKASLVGLHYYAELHGLCSHGQRNQTGRGFLSLNRLLRRADKHTCLKEMSLFIRWTLLSASVSIWNLTLSFLSYFLCCPLMVCCLGKQRKHIDVSVLLVLLIKTFRGAFI